jgi:sterol desaturase/sphingolipid hydroxylase (fatty acid hydroxylase superfamily)
VTKEQEYKQAMDTFHRNPFYNRAGVGVSAVIMTLQALSLAGIDWALSPVHYALLFVAAYLVTDFVNGLVHMYMDNNHDYTSIVGPLIAVFHLHHKLPRYTDRHPALIYILESGSKNWLVVYLAFVVCAQHTIGLPPWLNFVLVMVGVLSSFAEVSHFLCHNSTSAGVRLLQRCGILLQPAHHALHHERDNVNYAFLNGVTDPLLNAIARRTCHGYITRVDRHVRAYDGPKSSNRA